MARKKIKSVSEQILSNMKAKKVTKVTLTGEYLDGIELNVLNTLDLDMVTEFSASIVSSCIDQDAATYMPEAYELAFGVCLLTYYAGVPMSEDPTLNYRIIYETDIVNQIIPHINAIQLRDIREMADRRINYELQLMSSAAGAKTLELLSYVDEIVSANEKMIESMRSIDLDGTMKHLSEIAIENHRPDAQDAKNGTVIPFGQLANKDD